MIFGVDYYPEHWDKSEWEKQAQLMREGNFNTVRIAEFSWKLLEPEEDKFDFSWLDEIIDLLSRYGISVILGTPTAAPPKWLADKYDVYMRDKYGRPRGYGSRRECCSNNTYYRERSRIIVERLAKRYGKSKNVIAWQIDNEFGCHSSTSCYCPHCKKEFAHWLRDKYKTIENLNKTYGTVFWSHCYDGFDDVILPAYNSCEGDYGDTKSHNPSLELDFYRFSSDSWVSFEKMQADIIRKYSDKPITHNLMGHFSDIDYYKLAEPLSVVSWDNYPDNQWGRDDYEYTSMAHEIMRGAKDRNFWVMEEQSGPCGWDVFGGTPRPGQLRLWTYQAAAHGCEGVVYFRFRSAPFGMEQYWLGVVGHDGVPRRRFFEIRQTGAELQKLSGLFVGAKSPTDVLIVKSYEAAWSHAIKRHIKDFDYGELLYKYYRANSRLGTNPACGPIGAVSEKYKVVYLPAYVIVTEAEKQLLEEYVRNGGTLVVTYLSGIKDENNNMITEPLPGKLRELSGAELEEFDTSPVKTKLSGGFGETGGWRDIMKTTAEVKAVYESEFYAGTPAVTVNRYGSGKVWYIGCELSDGDMLTLVKAVSDGAGARYLTPPDGTEIIKRISYGGREYYMLLNFTDKAQNMGIRGVSQLGGKEFNGTLEAYGAEIICEGEN